MTGELEGQVAIVTGGGRGVGRAIAQALAAAGASVMVASRTAEQLNETVALIDADGGRAAALPADTEQRVAVEAMLAETERAFGPLTLLVNNAGATSTTAGPFETLDLDDVRKTIDNNLVGAMLCTRLALPGMLERGHGRIINVASGAGIVCQPFVNVYSVAKAGLIRFSENLAMEVKDRGVAVFAITPGMVRTKATEVIWQVRKMDPLPGILANVYGPPHENAVDDDAWQPPERAGELCRFLATGAADRLSGRFFSTYYDEAEIVAHADEVERDMLYTLRLPTLHGVEGPTTQEDFARARKA
ncbi:MAG TPA: SDR family oxidoreductase [Vicinamibacterales bacterium]|jgi:NAD(P)-dependent dehydrogenase (short-subunit alcohol dehydrogenase family)